MLEPDELCPAQYPKRDCVYDGVFYEGFAPLSVILGKKKFNLFNEVVKEGSKLDFENDFTIKNWFQNRLSLCDCDLVGVLDCIQQ
jgi:hypothetical protein